MGRPVPTGVAIGQRCNDSEHRFHTFENNRVENHFAEVGLNREVEQTDTQLGESFGRVERVDGLRGKVWSDGHHFWDIPSRA